MSRDWWRPTTRDAFDRFAAEQAPKLVRTGFVITRDLSTAQDLTQETLLRVAKRWTRVSHMEFPGAYARQTLVRLAVRELRRRDALAIESLEDGSTAVADERAARAITQIDQRSELLWLLESLPPKQRLVLVLRYYEEMSEAEVADVLGWRLGTVKSTASRALDHLRGTWRRANDDTTTGPMRRPAP